jgi:5-methylcytosine-specific restriction endonuclease McrA
VEHLLSFKHGGTDNINNLALACKDCNLAVGHKSIPEKIRYRDLKFNNNFTLESVGLI